MQTSEEMWKTTELAGSKDQRWDVRLADFSFSGVTKGLSSAVDLLDLNLHSDSSKALASVSRWYWNVH